MPAFQALSLFGQEQMKTQLELFKGIFDGIPNGCLIADANGTILYINRPYGRFLEVDPEACVGRHCTDIVPNTRMHIVAKSGQAEMYKTQRIKGQLLVVHRIPIKKRGRVMAVFGLVMFSDVKEVETLAKKLSILETKVKLYEKELLALRSTRYTLESIVSKSRAMGQLKKIARQAAGNAFPVLITGESGTGKELFAQGIHQASDRRIHPFVRINCAAIPKELLESELFGYEKGAFSGARPGGKPGKFELAHNGTIFLDEIGDLPVEMQPKLLRVLEEKEVERLGGRMPIQTQFRLIAATNQDLREMIAKGSFRQDLFYRLNVIRIGIPPLRKRKADILPIAKHLLRNAAEESALGEIGISEAAGRTLTAYAWPGNVRELANAINRALAVMESGTEFIEVHHLPFQLTPRPKDAPARRSPRIREIQASAEKKAISSALTQANHNKTLAARLLGIHRTHLYKKMKKYGIAP
jgi:transcriptional regulator with PAS, ATPase and Fis domain